MLQKTRKAILLCTIALVCACTESSEESPSSDSSGAQGGETAEVKSPTSYALWFDGNDDYLQTTKWLDGTPEEFCLEFWARPDTMNPYYGHVSILAHRAAGNDKFLRYEWIKDTYSFAGAIPENRTIVVQGRASPTRSGWHHVALVGQGSSITLYLDGAEAGQTSSTALSNWSLGHAASFIGGDPTPGTRLRGSFRGMIDEVRIWSKSRSASEILAGMSKSIAPDAPGLTACWNFDEGAGPTARDGSGHGLDATLGSTPGPDANDPLWIRSDCPAGMGAAPASSGHSLWFSGAGGMMRSQPLAGLSGSAKAATVETWARPSAPLRTACIVAVESALNQRDFKLALGPGGSLSVVVRTAAGEKSVETPPAVVRADHWQHVAASIAEAGVTLFVDGKEVMKQSLDAAPVFAGRPLVAGSASGNVEPFAGELDDLRVWSEARTGQQIRETMRKEVPSDAPGLVGYWRFDEGRGQVAVDWSRNAAHGVLGDVVLPDMHDPVWLASDLSVEHSTRGFPGTSADHSGAVFFDGVDDYIQLGNDPSLRLKGPITIEAWVKTASMKAEAPILSKENVSGKQNAYSLLLRNNKPVFRVSDGSSGCCGDQGWFPAEGDNQLVARTWQHVAGVYDGKNISIYLDGVLEDSLQFTQPITDIPFMTKIGTNALVRNGRYVFHGQIDEVRIWNVARKQEDILAGMNVGLKGDEPGLVGYWTFDETGPQGSTTGSLPIVFDRSGWSNHGFLGGKLVDNAQSPRRVESEAPIVPAEAP